MACLYTVWFHGDMDLLPEPTRVSVTSNAWYVDDIKDALVKKAKLDIGASSIGVVRAVLQQGETYVPRGARLEAQMKLNDPSLGDTFRDDAHFFAFRLRSIGENGN